MRIASSLLLAAAAVATCVMSTSEVSWQKPMDAEHLASDRSAASTHSAATVNRLLRASEATDEEDRGISIPTMTTATTRASSTSKKMLTIGELLDDFARPGSMYFDIYGGRYERAKEKLEKLKLLDLSAMRRFQTEKLNTGNVLAKLKHDIDKLNLPADEALKKSSEMLIVMARLHDSQRQADEAHAQFKMDAPSWIASRKSIKDVFGLLKLKDEEGIFATSKLEVLKMYIEAYNKEFKKNHKLLDALIEGFESEAEVAKILSFAHMGDLYKIKAKVLRDELLDRWLDHRVSAGDVVKMLYIQGSGNEGIHYEHLEMLQQYIDLLKKNHLGPGTDVYTCLRETLGDRKFAIQILAGMVTGQKSEVYLDCLFDAWQEQRIRPDELYTEVFKTTNADELENSDEAAFVEFILMSYRIIWNEHNKPKESSRDAPHRSRKANKRGHSQFAKRPSK